MEIKEISFEKTSQGEILFTDNNLTLLKNYIIPIVENNHAWGTERVTLENFTKDPTKFSEDINNTIPNFPESRTFVALQDNNPVGLLVYVLEDISKPSNNEFTRVLFEMVNNLDSKYWEELISISILDKDLLNQYFKELYINIINKQFYSRVGIVLIPELQGKKSGISDQLYKKMDSGFVFGRTSTPQAVAKRRSIFPNTLFFPIVSKNEISSLHDLLLLTVVAARTFSKPDYKDYLFGVSQYNEFDLRDKEEYLNLSNSYLEKGKITRNDYKRLEYILGNKKSQGALISLSE